MDIYSLIHDFGPSIGIILFFLGRDAAREERMEVRLDEQNAFIRTKLVELIGDKKDDDN